MPTWAPSISEKSETFEIDTDQGANTYDLVTATGGDVVIEAVNVYVNTAVTGLTSLAIQTDDTTSTEIMSAAEGLLANLTGGKNVKSFTTRFLLPSTKKIRYTIVGTGSAGLVKVAIKYRALTVGARLV